MIAARGLGFDVVGRSLVDGVDLDVVPGQLLVLAGANGAGKSTLLRLLAGERKPSRGTVHIDGTPVHSLRGDALARRRAVLSQNVAAPALTVVETVALGRLAYGPSPSDTAVEQALEECGLTPWAERLVPTLSGGEIQRVHLARIRAQLGDAGETKYCFLDEPASAMDMGRQIELMRRLRGWADGGVGVVVVLHDLNLAARFADRMAVLRGGRLEACGSPGEVLTAPLIERAFDTRAAVVPHPVLGHPLVLPLSPL